MAAASPRPTLRGFWDALPTAGRWLLFDVAFTHIGRGMVLPFGIVYLHEVRHLSYAVAGALMALGPLIGLATTGPGGALVDRIGARLVLIWAGLTGAVASVIIGLSSTVPWLAVGMVVLGIGGGVVWPAASSLVASVVSGALRQQYFGVNFALLNLGIGVGGLLSGTFVDVLRPWTFTAIYLVDAVFSLVPVLVLLGPLRAVHGKAEAPEEDEAAASPSDYLGILRSGPMALVVGTALLASVIGYGQMEAGVPGFVREVAKASTRTLGYGFALNTIVIVALQFAVMKVIHGARRTRVLLGMVGLWSSAWIVLAGSGLSPGTWWASAAVVAYMALFGLGECFLQPSMPAIVNDLAPPHLRGRYNSLQSAAWTSGAIIAPLISGWLLSRHLPWVLVALTLVGCLALVGLILTLERRIPAHANGIAEHAPDGEPVS